MKKLLLIFLIGILTFQTTWSQSHELTIQPKLDQYFLATQTKDWKTVLDMINPKIFSLAPRDMMEQMYSQMENEAGMRFDFENMKVLDFKEGLVLTDTIYVPVDYSMTMDIYLNPDLYSTEKEIQQLYESFQITYLGQGIQFIKENLKFSLDIKNTLIASSPLNQESWTFLEYKANDPLTSFLLPTEVIDRLQRGWIE
ncbi:hypothetical protein [Algoriphagus sp. AK58]|uniref:hypothetical protein n=1 Tax=Algoriphagus sp. AK58 TaxID=1406877 RepID=UPI00164F8ECB|nr:hypothetical protein [Algoriphagus sp. AK58]